MAAAISNRRMATAGRQPPATDIERPAVNRNCSIELSVRLLVILPDHVIMMDTAKKVVHFAVIYPLLQELRKRLGRVTLVKVKSQT